MFSYTEAELYPGLFREVIIKESVEALCIDVVLKNSTDLI